ncbi:hypothetical protein ARMGADRAFT_1074649 [Armillaria gallica]|uniref:Uncharacterized protein n=1 Tax=Armillaria gallica TaxID=47427 RepID=A0A2H3DX46_ARMGA|nr:hypothetical protein ARMGADRAFT_1074649 [Armillaria gallica]
MGERRSGTHEVSDDYYISHEHPEYNVFIEWSYEIDLDNLIHLVGSQATRGNDNWLAREISLLLLCLLVTRYRIFNLDNIPSRDSFTKKSLCTLYTFAFTALSSCKYWTPWEPNIFCDYPAKVSEEHSLAVWLRENLCVFTWTHLYDESNLKAAVVAITTCLRSQSPASNSFGVAFPLFHCVIVKQTGKVTHTGALDFLPSWYACSPSTPGITALARLSEYLDHLSLGHPDVAVWTTNPLHTLLRLEILARISEYINDSTTLLAYTRASVQTRAACKAMLMTPWVKDLQLVAVPPDSVLGDGSSPFAHDLEVEGDDDETENDDEDGFDNDFLYNAKFLTQFLDEKRPDSVFTVRTKENQEVFDGVRSHKY